MATRSKDSNRVLDPDARKRRKKKALEALEQDNYHDEPHADLVMSKRIPKFEESSEEKAVGRKRKTKSSEYYKLKFRKNINALIEEERKSKAEANYITAKSPTSLYPARRLCSVCGFTCDYTCVQCGSRFCSMKCKSTHVDTRCMKWTA